MKWFLVVAVAMLAGSCGLHRGTAQFSRNVGTATALETVEKAHRMLALYQFEIERELGPPSILIETRWLDRMPFGDEQMLGIDAAQVRVVISARPRSTTSTLGEVYNVSMTVVQRVALAGGEEWSHRTITPGAEEYAEGLAQALRDLLDVGVRRF